MPTRADIAATVADMLARSDLGEQIRAEIVLAVEHLNRVGGFPFQEARAGTITTAAGVRFYASVDFTSGEGSAALGVVPASSILDIHYARIENGASWWPMDVLPYATFEDLSQGSPGGVPTSLTRYADRIGVWPTPSGVSTVEVSATIKPTVPETDEAESVWFDFARELVEARVAGAVALKYARDAGAAQMFRAVAASAEAALSLDAARRNGTGRIRPTSF